MKKKVRVKPSKGQSIVGFIVGICFCAIGAFEVIPHAGIFGIVWTLFAVIITVIDAINIWTNDGIATHEIIFEEDEKNDDKNGTIEERLIEVEKSRTVQNVNTRNLQIMRPGLWRPDDTCPSQKQ